MVKKENLIAVIGCLDYNLEKAKKQFGRDVKPMLKCFEYWFGPYPFYEDGYKLVESSHLGMEHQSATAYGNHYMDGYLGMDLSGSGWGRNGITLLYMKAAMNGLAIILLPMILPICGCMKGLLIIQKLFL